jgi:hypothetical protein
MAGYSNIKMIGKVKVVSEAFAACTYLLSPSKRDHPMIVPVAFEEFLPLL